MKWWRWCRVQARHPHGELPGPVCSRVRLCLWASKRSAGGDDSSDDLANTPIPFVNSERVQHLGGRNQSAVNCIVLARVSGRWRRTTKSLGTVSASRGFPPAPRGCRRVQVLVRHRCQRLCCSVSATVEPPAVSRASRFRAAPTLSEERSAACYEEATLQGAEDAASARGGSHQTVAQTPGSPGRSVGCGARALNWGPYGAERQQRRWSFALRDVQALLSEDASGWECGPGGQAAGRRPSYAQPVAL